MPRTALASSPVMPVISLPMFMAEDIDRFSAAEVRQAICAWVGEGRMDTADALVAAGLAMYPDSQDILAMGALVAEVNQDWAQAQDCLERLVAVQGDAVSAEVLHHLARVLRCRGAYFLAFIHAEKAILRFPQHSGLIQAHTELAELLESVPVLVAYEAQVG